VVAAAKRKRRRKVKQNKENIPETKQEAELHVARNRTTHHLEPLCRRKMSLV
jgi:hypothetical protein